MSTADLHPVILAGGYGTRLARVLRGLPKPMAPAAGRPFVEWVVRYLARSGFTGVTVSTGHLGEVIETHFASNPVPGVAVDCVRESTPLGTAGAFVHAARSSRRRPEGWLVLNGDSLIFADLAGAVRKFAKSGAVAAIVARPLDSPGRFGTLSVGEDGRLVAFAEKAAGAHGPALINAGVYLLRDPLQGFPERVPLSFEYDVFPELLRSAAAVDVLPSDAPFLDIGTEESLALADQFIAENRERF